MVNIGTFHALAHGRTLIFKRVISMCFDNHGVGVKVEVARLVLHEGWPHFLVAKLSLVPPYFRAKISQRGQMSFTKNPGRLAGLLYLLG